MGKFSMLILCITFLSGFYKEDDTLIDLEEINIELGEQIKNEKIQSFEKLLNNRNFFIESSIPTNNYGEATEIGTYNYYIVYRDEERKYSRLTTKRSTITVTDTIKPVIKFTKTSLTIDYGSKIKLEDFAECIDLSMCEMSIIEDIDTKSPGTYTITIEAIDRGENKSTATTEITIKEKPKPVIVYSGNVLEFNEYNNSLNKLLSEEEKNNLRYKIANFSKQFAGNPYVYGGTSLYGADCSGFVMALYNYFGYKMPRMTNDQAIMGIRVNYSDLKPGDIIAYHANGYVYHTGIYLGNGMMIHAATPSQGIKIQPMYEGYREYRRIIY